MKLTQINNACCIYEANGFKLLCDPWLTDGAFEGSWYHYPPLVTTYATIQDCDALYISHLHPDHYDETLLRQLVANKPAIPIVVLSHGSNFLHRKLETLGFTNIIRVRDRETITLGPLEITVYAPFTHSPFDDSALGNFLDSAIVVEANGKTILNANDNTPTREAARALFDHHGPFTVAQLKDSLAGAYPSCFINLSHEEKISEAKRLINRQLNAMCEVANILRAEWFQPFAGDYQLAGKLVPKNEYLGVPGKKYSAEFIASHGIRPLILNEQGSINLVTNEVISPYRKSIISYEKWAEEVSQIPFRWEKDPEPSPKEMRDLVIEAREKLWLVQERFNFKPNYTISMNMDSDYKDPSKAPAFYTFNLKTLKATYSIGSLIREKEIGRLECYLDPRLLKRILTKDAHWNNAEIGAHIDFIRVGAYQPDISLIMSFFHV